MSPRCGRLAVLKIPRGDGANLESRGARVTQIRGLDVATLRPFGRSQSWRATVTQIRALEVVYMYKLPTDRLSGLYWYCFVPP